MRPFDVTFIWHSLLILIPYTGVTLGVMALSLLAGTILGVLLAWGRLSGFKPAESISALYVHIIRCTPSIVLLFVVYYGFPGIYQYFTGIHAGYTGKLFYVVDALAMMSGASMCELMRSAYTSVDSGQSEAAFCIGMNRLQTAWFVIIPQAVSVAVPNFCNEVIILLKQGSLAFTIGFIDLMGETQVLIGRSYGAHGLEAYIALACIYWLLTLIIERILSLVETHYLRGISIVGREGGIWS